MTDSPQTDLFILHSDSDTEWVENWLRPRLEAQGLTVATHEDFRIGRTVALNYELAVAQSRYVAFVLTPEGLDDRWAAFAASLALHRDPANLTERLLPLLLRPCPQLPAPLRDLTPADFSDEGASEVEVRRLVDVLKGTGPERKNAADLSFLALLSQVTQSIKRHPLVAALALLGALFLAILAIYDNTGLREAYPIFPTKTPLPTATGAPTAAPTATPRATQTPLPTPTPLAFQPAAEGETLIVIAEFVHREGADDTDPAGEIAIAIREAAKKLEFTTLRVEVEATQIGRLERDTAESLGRRYGAAIVIWGEVSTVAVTTNFLNLSEPALPAADVSIRETERTQSKQEVSGLPLFSEYVTENLPAQLKFLAFFAVGSSYYLAENFSLARIAIAESIASLPDDATLEGRDAAFFTLGLLVQIEGDFSAAIASYDKAIELNPEYADAYNNRGNALSGLERYAEAIASFDKAIALNPELAVAYYNRGVALVDLERYAEAIASYDKAIALNPEYAAAYNNRGNALSGLEQIGRAHV